MLAQQLVRDHAERGSFAARADLHDLPAQAEQLATEPVGLLAEGLHQRSARVAECCRCREAPGRHIRADQAVGRGRRGQRWS
jgi:hypothetical protein